MAGSTLAFPGALWLMESASPARGKGKLSAAMKLSAALGLCGGFLYAYQRSTFRFWGWSENERQGESSLSDEMQGVAHRNSVFSQLNLAVLPWFNVVNHKYHS